MATSPIPIDQAAQAASTKAEQNRINAQSSTGPKSEEGKRRSSLNALRHGFTGHVVVLPWEDLQAFKAFEVRCHKMYAPVGDLETEATQSLSELRWRMRRCGVIEDSLFSLGHETYADRFSLGDGENTQPIQSGLAAATTFRVDADTLLKLSLWEQRFLKQFQAAETRLFKLQAERQAKLKEEQPAIEKLHKLHKQQGRPFHPESFGFVSQPADIDRLFRREDALRRGILPENHPQE